MKRILITGQNSYIGNSFEQYIKENYPSDYYIEKISMKNDEWKSMCFGDYDSIFHVAGIAHSDTGKATAETKMLYYKINTELTAEIAAKAKAEGVRQFVFLSSSIVYGESAPIGKEKIITKDSPVDPANFYGDSKLQAEVKISAIANDCFKVCIMRLPMIYGKGSKGNYPILSKIAKKLPIFPKVSNSRSMLYIGNLVEFTRLVIENEDNGIFWPQNKEYSNVSRLVQMIASVQGKKIRLIGGFSWALKIMSHLTRLVNKAFGNLVYEQSMSEYKYEYRKYTLEESIRIVES